MRTRANTQRNDSVNVKLLVLGVGSVGKSSLLLRFTDQQWLPDEEMESTIGVDTWVMSRDRGGLNSRSCIPQDHKLEVHGRRMNLNIWVRGFIVEKALRYSVLTVHQFQDTAGDERLRSLTTSYYRGTQGIILGAFPDDTFEAQPGKLTIHHLVYDVTNRDSFDAVSWWFTERSQYAPEGAVVMIVGNKTDQVTSSHTNFELHHD